MNCSNCGQNRDIRLSYSICYMPERYPPDKLSKLRTLCERCFLKLGYARKFTEEEQKLWRNEDKIYMEKLNNW